MSTGHAVPVIARADLGTVTAVVVPATKSNDLQAFWPSPSFINQLFPFMGFSVAESIEALSPFDGGRCKPHPPGEWVVRRDRVN
jgi:hypothetical protein